MVEEIERYVPDLIGQISYEHRHRYGLAIDLVEGRTVLDIACGEGYGAAALAKYASSVVGVDVNEGVIEAAKSRYTNENLSFLVGDCRRTGLPSGKFDVVVSFETIEHIEKQDQFLREMRRIMKKTGILLISTPNEPVYNESQAMRNPFHVKELDKTEFSSLLRKYFKNVKIFGQRMFVGSVVCNLDNSQSPNSSEYKAFKRSIQDANNVVVTSGAVNLSEPTYFVAVCANDDLSYGGLVPSIFMDERDDLWFEHLQKFKWASNLHNEDEELRSWVKSTQEEMDIIRSKLETQRSHNESLVQSLTATREQLDRHVQEANLNIGLMSRLTQAAELRDAEVKSLQSQLSDTTALVASISQSNVVFSKLKEERDLASLRLKELEERLADRDRELERYMKAFHLEQEQSQKWQSKSREDLEKFEALQNKMSADYRVTVKERDRLFEKFEIVSRGQIEAQQNAFNFLERIELLRRQLDEAKSDYQMAARSRDEAHEQMARRERNFDDVRSHLMAEHARERGALSQALEMARAELTRAQSDAAQLPSLRQEMNLCQLRISELHGQMAKREGDFDDVRSHLMAEHARERDALTQALETARAELMRAQSDAAQLPSLRQEMNLSQLRVSELNEQMAKREGDFDESRALLVQEHESERDMLAQALAAASREQEEAKGVIAVQNQLLARKKQQNRRLLRSLKTNDDAARVKQVALAQRVEFAEDELRQINIATTDFRKQASKWANIVAMERFLFRELACAAQRMRSSIPKSNLRVIEGGRIKLAEGGRLGRRTVSRHEAELVRSSGLFDADWYRSVYSDLSGHKDPLRHFIEYGLFEFRDPHPLFSAAWYWNQLPYGVDREQPPFLHYLLLGRPAFVAPHPLFDSRFYLDSNPDVKAAGLDPLLHFLASGETEGRDPHPLVKLHRLRGEIKTVSSTGLLRRFIEQPECHLKSSTTLFDPIRYKKIHADLKDNINPLLHYLVEGWREGRDPIPLFAGDWYLAKNIDLLDPVQIPLVHYVRHGAAEGRSPHPLFEPTLVNPGGIQDTQGRNVLEVYLEDGWKRRNQISHWFTAHELLELVPERNADQDPLSSLLDAATVTERELPDWALGRAPTARMAAWPPTLEPTYWIAQDLRDYLIKTHGEEAIPQASFLLGIIERFPHGLDSVSDLETLSLAWMRSKAHQQRADWKDGAPDVTVIVPVHNQKIFTLACLCSVLSIAGRATFEIIVGDDCSTDGTSELFLPIGGCVRVIRHEQNLGFLKNCNDCAKNAMGEYVVFLNNDAIVLPNWLDGLIDVLKNQKNVGLVGSKLLNVDGSLQEAGGIFWSDGSAWNFGRNQNARLSAFNYVKDVDYCSGASIALRASNWRELGGFDPIFSPAYCEDADLAFRIREVGLRAVYTPFSEVIHHEGVSHGRDINTGVKAYQVRNTKLFRQRWSDMLSCEHFPNGESVFLARDRSRNKKHVLVIDHYIPQFDRDAGSRTMFQYMCMFIEAGYQLILWPDNLNEDREYVAAYQMLGIEVIYGPEFVNGFSRWIAENGNAIDYVFATRPHVTEKYIDSIRVHSPAKIIYYGQDLHYARMLREQALGLSNVGDLEISTMKDLELSICRKSDFALYPSAEECKAVGSEIKAPNKVIEFPIFFFSDVTLAEAESRVPVAGPAAKAMMFVGGFNHSPNIDGVLWFASEVWPLIREHDHEFRFRIAGSNPPSEILQLDGLGIEVLGRVSDEKLTELYQTSFCTIAPLRYGAGVKGKVIEAFAAGTPVVTTTTGVQGIDGNVAYVTDDPKEMARLIIQASQDPVARAAKAKSAIEFLRRFYSTSAAAECLGRAMPELLGLVRAS